MQRQLTVCLLLFAAFFSNAQTAPNFFSPINESEIALRANARRMLIPNQFRTFQLDFEKMQSALEAAPMEFSAGARSSKCRVALPLADGSFEDFAMREIQIMHPDLQKKFPGIRTWSGESITSPGKTVRMTTSVRGLSAAIFQPDFGVNYVETYAWGQTETYMAYDRTDIPASARIPAKPTFVENAGAAVLDNETRYVPDFQQIAEERGSEIEKVNLKVYRYAVTTTGEFSQDVGTTKEEVLAKVVESTNLVSAVFERDMYMRLQLVPNNDLLIYMFPASDPFFGTEVGEFMSTNPAVLNAVIGESAYDVGHNYCKYLGGSAAGVAGGITCTDSKGRGSSSGGGDYGDWFRNVIGQEVGHQMSGGHTWNRCGNVAGRNGDVAMEPGSGSTIMSYAGSCGSDNVQGSSDLYYHAGSIEEILNFIENGTGNTCGTYLETTNHHPEVALPYQNNFTIPMQTPFELNGSATDPDGHPLTYCWEQIDIGPETELASPTGSCPLFRTWPATAAATNRYFPKLQTVINNGFDITEQLPTYGRDMTFRLTVRDNQLNGGGVAWQDVEFKATGAAGPFLVESPNSASDVWQVGDYVLVKWDVSKTDIAPVNCKKVNIRLSTDGGLTYPITLASGVNNDGSQYVPVPNNLTTKARVRVDAADNVFYDISNANFKIVSPTAPSLSLGLESDGAQVCLPASFSTNVVTVGLLGFSTPVSLDLQGLPAGMSASFGQSTLTPGQTTSLVIDMTNFKEEGTFTLEVVGFSAGADTVRRPIVISTVSNDFSSFALISPPDGATGLSQSQILDWTTAPDAKLYDLQMGKSPDFDPSTILYDRPNVKVDSFKIVDQLEKATAYFWRVRPTNECGVHDWTEPFFFSTKVDNCTVNEAQDLPKNLSANGTPSLESKINILSPGVVNDLNVKQLRGYHASFKDLDVTLVSPAGTEVLLFRNKCGTIYSNFNFGLDSDAPAGFQCPPSSTGVAVRPTGSLANFSGQNIDGTWTLKIKDLNPGGEGTIEQFKLEFCSSASLNPPFLVNNNPLNIDPGVNEAIGQNLLLVEDHNNTHNELIFTLLTVPEHGHLELNNGKLSAGDEFSQTDIDAGLLKYFDYGSLNPEDSFRFIVYDGEGGWLGSTKYVIHPKLVGTHDPLPAGKLDFSVFPNPTSDAVSVSFGKPVESQTAIRVFDLAGQLLKTTFLNPGSELIRLNISDLPQGIYVLSVQNAEGSGVRKVVLR